jgi:hypothetical protein
MYCFDHFSTALNPQKPLNFTKNHSREFFSSLDEFSPFVVAHPARAKIEAKTNCTTRNFAGTRPMNY